MRISNNYPPQDEEMEMALDYGRGGGNKTPEIQCSKALVLTFLLIMAGDVELNPGPDLQDSPKDLKLLVTVLSVVEKDWFDIGLLLGIKIDKLKSFENDKYSNRRLLTEVLSYWLKRNTDTPVTWATIVDILKALDQGALAIKVEENYMNVLDSSELERTVGSETDVEMEDEATDMPDVNMDSEEQEESDGGQTPIDNPSTTDHPDTPSPKKIKLSSSRKKSKAERKKAAKKRLQKRSKKGSPPHTSSRKKTKPSLAHDTDGRTRLKSVSQLERSRIISEFKQSWNDQTRSCPSEDQIEYVFSVENNLLYSKFQNYCRTLQNQKREVHYHGAPIDCDITNSQELCTRMQCAICSICRTGFDKSYIRQSTRFQRFGCGFYLAPNSSKCHAYTIGAHGYRAMLVCEVYPGEKYVTDKDDVSLSAPPSGYDSVHGSGGELNYDEIVLYNPDAILPKAIIVYKKDGMEELPNTCPSLSQVQALPCNMVEPTQTRRFVFLYVTLTSVAFVFYVTSLFI